MNLTTPREIERGRALVAAIRKLPEGATPTAVLYLQEEILAKRSQMKSKSRTPWVPKIAVNQNDLRALVRFMGGARHAAPLVNMAEETLYVAISIGRIRPEKWERLKRLAKERMDEILQT